jgi:hypothetical protein
MTCATSGGHGRDLGVVDLDVELRNMSAWRLLNTPDVCPYTYSHVSRLAKGDQLRRYGSIPITGYPARLVVPLLYPPL